MTRIKPRMSEDSLLVEQKALKAIAKVEEIENEKALQNALSNAIKAKGELEAALAATKSELSSSRLNDLEVENSINCQVLKGTKTLLNSNSMLQSVKFEKLKDEVAASETRFREWSAAGLGRKPARASPGLRRSGVGRPSAAFPTPRWRRPKGRPCGPYEPPTVSRIP